MRAAFSGMQQLLADAPPPHRRTLLCRDVAVDAAWRGPYQDWGTVTAAGLTRRWVQMPEFALLHTLSASREAISSLRFNARGDWLALGCASLVRPKTRRAGSSADARGPS